MNNDILLELTKRMNDNNFEKTTVYRNGMVEFEIMKNGILSKESKSIDIVHELEEQLVKAYDIMLLMYANEQISNYTVLYNNFYFYNFDLFVDINLMIKFNKVKNLSVFSQYEKEKDKLNLKNETADDIVILDEMERNKQKIDLSDVMNHATFDNEREIISFKLTENSTFELGESRFFSDTIDIAEDVEIPDSLDFVGQLNLNEFTKYDVNKLLPTSGMLYFFQSPPVVDDHLL